MVFLLIKSINFLLNSSATNIEGDYTYNKIDKELISYIEKLSKEKEELLECLSELKNSKTDQCQKQTALERLKKFLADHAEDIGFNGSFSHVGSDKSHMNERVENRRIKCVKNRTKPIRINPHLIKITQHKNLTIPLLRYMG